MLISRAGGWRETILPLEVECVARVERRELVTAILNSYDTLLCSTENRDSRFVYLPIIPGLISWQRYSLVSNTKSSTCSRSVWIVLSDASGLAPIFRGISTAAVGLQCDFFYDGESEFGDPPITQARVAVITLLYGIQG